MDFRPWSRLSSALASQAKLLNAIIRENSPVPVKQKGGEVAFINWSTRIDGVIHDLLEIADDLKQSGRDLWMAEIREYDLPPETIRRHIQEVTDAEHL